MDSRSAWPTAAITLSMSLPVLVAVSRDCVPDIDTGRPIIFFHPMALHDRLKTEG
jgi:hypothetical protein